MNAIKFKNFTNEDFEWKYDGIPYNFPAGSEMFLEDYKAHHFAKHLVDREMNKAKVRTDFLTERAKLESQCFPASEPVTPIEAINLNEGAKVKKAKKVEPEFEELSDKPKKK